MTPILPIGRILKIINSTVQSYPNDLG